MPLKFQKRKTLIQLSLVHLQILQRIHPNTAVESYEIYCK
jgi:hypothetical protein